MNVGAHIITNQVTQILEAGEGTFDIPAIVAELIEGYDLTGESPSDTVVSIGDGFWSVVFRHAKDA